MKMTFLVVFLFNFPIYVLELKVASKMILVDSLEKTDMYRHYDVIWHFDLVSGEF